jgi:hypothetical protein
MAHGCARYPHQLVFANTFDHATRINRIANSLSDIFYSLGASYWYTFANTSKGAPY